jgi:lipopolysaccharide/colanic/teichoic acid biosynthesis glycosyltransferase
VTLTVFAPLLLLIAAVIRLTTGGPALFLQRRSGHHGEVFRIWKFRTMHVAEDGDVVTQARQADPRLTHVGAFLRKYNLDELPQLINVLAGDMSLVGPRPHALTHDLMFERDLNSYARRRRVKPGITGWAQINGHRGRISSPADLRKRVACDLYYIRNYSILFDLHILLRTLSPSAFRNAV